MPRAIFFGLGHLSNGDVSIAADIAGRLPAAGFDVLFVTTAQAAPHVRALGLDVRALDGATPEENLAITDALVDGFRPDLLVAADAFTLNYSTAWSGLDIALLRSRYGRLTASFDQYDYAAARYVVDFYGGHRTHFPRLLDECHLVIRNSPLNRPAPGSPGSGSPGAGGTPAVAVARMSCHAPGVRAPRWAGRGAGVPTIFLANSKWENVNVLRSRAMDQLMAAMPALLHSHVAALRRPVRVVHVGPSPWTFPVAESIEYEHVPRLTPGEFADRLTRSDLFVTTNAVSVTLTQAVLAGVPALVLQNAKVLNLAALARTGSLPEWLAAAAPGLQVAYPFRVFPWGWHEFLAPVLTDNPYQRCFLTAGVFERTAVLRSMTALLDDPATRATLEEAQARLRHELAALPTPGEALLAAMTAVSAPAEPVAPTV